MECYWWCIFCIESPLLLLQYQSSAGGQLEHHPPAFSQPYHVAMRKYVHQWHVIKYNYYTSFIQFPSEWIDPQCHIWNDNHFHCYAIIHLVLCPAHACLLARNGLVNKSWAYSPKVARTNETVRSVIITWDFLNSKTSYLYWSIHSFLSRFGIKCFECC